LLDIVGVGDGGFKEGGRDCSVWWRDIRPLKFYI